MKEIRLGPVPIVVLLALVALVVLAGVLVWPAARDEVSWRLAELRDTKRAYSDFSDRARQNSRRGSQASERAAERMGCLRATPRISPGLFWRWMRWDGSPEACVEYLETWPRGPFRAEAIARLDGLLWPKAAKENTVASYQAYLDFYEGLTHAREAKQRQRELRLDDRPFDAAAREGTAEAWRAFLEKFCGHRRSGEALARLTEAEPKSVFRLAREGTLVVTGGSDAVDEFGVDVGKHQAETVAFRIPVGTFWKAVNPRVQDAVAIQSFDDELRDNGPYWYCTLAVGTGMRKRPVTDGDKFTPFPTPPNDDVARMAAYFSTNDTSFRVGQAAMWIVTDNATLLELQKRLYGQTNNPLALEPHDVEVAFEADEAIDAIREVDEAGFDVRQYAIWNDREGIFWELLPEDLDGWRYLVERDPDGIGREWESVKLEMARRLESADPCAVPALKARQVEVDISTPPGSRPAAWLAWYLREFGHKVDVAGNDYEDDDPKIEGEDQKYYGSPDTWVGFEPNVAAQGRAIVEIVRVALVRRVLDDDSTDVTLRGGSMEIDVAPWGTEEAEREKMQRLKWGDP